MAQEKIIKAVVTFKINVKGVGKKPGDVIEGPESEINALVGIGRATKNMDWKPEKPAAKSKEK